MAYSTERKLIEKLAATEPQPFLNVLINLKTVKHSLESGETPSSSASHQTPNCVQRS